MIGVPENPGWLVPSIVTVLVIAGRAVAGLIVCTPEPGMSKSIVSAVDAALAFRIAWRSEPGPLSLVLVTVTVEKSWENSDVLPAGSVAVAVKNWPTRLGVDEGG